MFGLFGTAAGSWAGRIPWVQHALDLSPGALGVALLAPAIGAILALPFAGYLGSRFGSRPMAAGGVTALGISIALPALAPNLAVLCLALAFWGAAGATLDVAVNAAGVEVERRAGRSLMSGLHGMWSVGGLVGAAFAGLVAGAGIGAPAHLAVIGLITVALGLAVAAWMVPGPASGQRTPTFALPSRGIVLIGVIGFCALFAEGAIADWSGVFLVNSRSTTEAVAATGYAVFSICMAAGRFGGDAAVTRFGAVKVVAVSATAGAIGLTVALAVPSVVAAWLGFGVCGLGMATIVPLAFSAAGHHGGGGTPAERETRAASSIAAVATMSYVGWLAGPPIIGGVASATSLPLALGVAAALIGVIAVLGRALRPAASG